MISKIDLVKKLLFFLLVFGLLFINLGTLSAAKKTTSTPSAKRVEVQQRIEEKRLAQEQKRQEIRERIETKKATKSAQLSQKKRERVENYWERLNKRLLAVILRLERLITRIESRLDKIASEEGDIDVADIQEQLGDASLLLVQAKLDLELANDSLEEVLLADDPKEAFIAIKDTIKEIKESLIETHRILVHVIGDIKGLRVGQGESDDSPSTETVSGTMEE